jgi:hypothetical protein
VQVWNYLLPSLQPLFERPSRPTEWTLFGPEAPGRQIAGSPANPSHPASLDPTDFGRLPGRPTAGLEATPSRRAMAMVDLDRAAPSEDGEPDRGFRFPDPIWRTIGTSPGEGSKPNPFTTAILANPATRMVPVVRRRGRQPPALV